MSESKRATPGPSDGSPRADQIGWDPDDALELDDAWFASADRYIGDTLIGRGLRPGETEMLALPSELVARFRSTGPDWQMLIELALKEWIRENTDRL